MVRYTPPPDAAQVAERQRRIIIALLWMLAIPPLVFALMVFGYSDQAPALLRSLGHLARRAVRLAGVVDPQSRRPLALLGLGGGEDGCARNCGKTSRVS